MSKFSILHARRASERIIRLNPINMRSVIERILALEENPTPNDCLEDDTLTNGYTVPVEGYVIFYLIERNVVKILNVYPGLGD